MSNTGVFNWCFIGAGTLAKTVAEEILASGRHKIAAVYTRNFQKCQAFAGQFGGTAYGNAEAAICAPEVDGVYIVTPHNSHYEYAELALSLGKPVLCEKPVTVTASEAEELFALAQEKGVYLAEAMWTWFSPVSRKVKEWVDTGALGVVNRVEIYHRCASRSYAPRCSDPNTAGGAVLDIGVYPLTYLYRLFGKPEKIQCIGELGGGIDLWEDVTLTFPGGLACTASISMCDPSYRVELYMEGSQGQVRCGNFNAAREAELVRADGTKEIFQAEGGYLHEFDTVAGEIRQGLAQSPLVPPGATVEVMKIMDECRRQLGLVYPFEKEGGTPCA